ncbi:cupin domain-containing protein [uncultured Desulfobulbus sp.]|uniref:cupin domain-containing protein n=1 Tax=uncultured Desulfobulbus sp. TaxID=239745 RepID=UPI0029C6C7FB|nr:cupin domain-containing protein [uncultured Desulfobulbus sp.]
MDQGNLLAYRDMAKGPEERFDQLLSSGTVRIERIVSTGQASPPGFWYDQDENEWVTLLAGAAELHFEDEPGPRRLQPGDWINIPTHCLHRVAWTDPDQPTVWLAVFY